MENTNALNSEKLLELEKLSTNVNSLQHQVNSLQGEVDSLLPVAQIALQDVNNYLVYTSIIVAAVTILFSGFGILLQREFSKDKEEIIAKATKTAEENIAKGLYLEDSKIKTELITAVLDSDEFNGAISKTRMFTDTSKRVERNESLEIGFKKDSSIGTQETQ